MHEEAFDERECKVDIDLARNEVRDIYTYKLLLLGAGESGKSTILKQIKLINRWKPSKDDMARYAAGLRTNIVECMQNVCEQAKVFYGESIEVKDASAERARASIVASKQEVIDDISEFFTPELATGIKALLTAEPFRKTLERRDEYWLLESFDYLIEHIDRIASPKFKPNEEDMLMARVRTTGIVETEFEHKVVEAPKTIYFKVVDVGGQRSERKKWLHCFDNVSAVLFVANLAGYNKRLFEDQQQNRLTESLELLGSVANKSEFSHIPFYLILNKKDLFEQQVRRGDIDSHFTDYKGDSKSMKDVLGFIKEKFLQYAGGKTFQDTFDISARVKVDVQGLFGRIKKQLYDSSMARNATKASSVLARLARREAQLKRYGSQRVETRPIVASEVKMARS